MFGREVIDVVDVVFVSCTLVMAAFLSRFTINSKTYSQIKWSLFIGTSILLLLILNVDSVASVSNQIAGVLNGLGIGYPHSWELKTREYDDVISGCYYITFFSTWVMLLITATYEEKYMTKFRKQYSIKTWSGLLVILWVFWAIFWSKSGFHSVTGRLVRTIYSTQFGLVVNQYLTVNLMGLALGLCIRALSVSRGRDR